MNTVREFHDHAMQSAEEMIRQRAQGNEVLALAHASAALNAELEAARLAFSKPVSATTRLVLLESAANLARDAKQPNAGIDLVIHALSMEDFDRYRPILFRILDTLRTYEHLQIEGVTLSDADVQLSISGPEAAPGFARADEITRRVENLRLLLVRSAMRRAGLPFEAAMPKDRRFRSAYTPFLSVARAASYAVTIRFGVHEQTELQLEDESREPTIPVRDALDEVVRVAKAYASGGPLGVEHAIGDREYAVNAASLLRHLSPDTERISTVGLTVTRDGRSDPIALPHRRAFDPPPVQRLPSGVRKNALPPQHVEVVGRLLEGSAKSPTRAWATIVQDDGESVKVSYDETSHGDIIDGYWKHRVKAVLLRIGATGLILQDIDDAP